MEFRLISLPPFKAATSGVDKEFDFSSNGILEKFDKYFSAIKPLERDSFMPRDFLFYDEEKQGMVWWWALSEDMYNGGNEVVDFEGGYYITYFYKDGDNETNSKLYNEAIEYIKNSDVLDLNIHQNHYAMGHIITPPEIIKAKDGRKWKHLFPLS